VAICAFEGAKEGDPISKQILTNAANSLVNNIMVIYNKCNFKNYSSVNIVFCGSCLTHDEGNGLLANEVKNILSEKISNFKILLPVITPSFAAARLAIVEFSKS